MNISTMKLPGGDYAVYVGAVRIATLHFTSGIKNSSPLRIEVKLPDEIFAYRTMSEALLDLSRLLKADSLPKTKPIPVWIQQASDAAFAREDKPPTRSEVKVREKAHDI